MKYRGLQEGKAAQILAWCILCLFIIYTIWSHHLTGPTKLPKYTLDSTYGESDDPCTGKISCLVVFVAPWCPSCHAAIPFIKNVAEYTATSHTGFKIIVGSDSEDHLREMSKNFGGIVYFDTRHEFQEALGFSSVPHWFLLNQDGELLTGFASGGVSGSTPKENIQYFFKLYLGKYKEFLPS